VSRKVLKAPSGFYVTILRTFQGTALSESTPVALDQFSASTFSLVCVHAALFLVLQCLREMSLPQRLHSTDYLVAAVTLLKTGCCLARSLRPWFGSVALNRVIVRMSWPTNAINNSTCRARSVVIVLGRLPEGATTMGSSGR
jgi:hypothetical protein